MITPEYLNEIMYSVEDKLSEVNEAILEQIIKRIMQAFENGEGNLFIPATIHDMQKLMNAGVLYEDIQKAVEKALPDISGAIKDAFYEAAGEISAQNNDVARQISQIEGLASVDVPVWEQSGIVQSAEELGMTRPEIRYLEAAYRRTNGEMKNLTRTTASKAQQTYVNACDKAYMKAQQGVSVQKAVVEAIKEVADQGVECVTYGGKRENIEVAIARAVRTGVNQANSEIVLMRCAEMGVQFVKVSAHLGARVTAAEDYTNHSWWQGRVYRINWDNSAFLNFTQEIAKEEEGFEWLDEMRKELLAKKIENDYPDFVETCGYGDILGIGGINCRHTFYPFYPGIQLDEDKRPDLKENEDRYRLEQRARAMEREIRKTKRELAGLKAAGQTTEEFKAAVKEVRAKLTAQSDKYLEFCKNNSLTPRNMSLKIK